VLETGNDLSFSLETANELRIISEFGPHNFDGYFATDRRLIGTVDLTERPLSDQLAKLETPNHQTPSGHRNISPG
jgi:hypothetical protein